MKPPPPRNAMRTLGLYQPFATLMLHGKIETRWVMAGRKPPFPLGPYLLYSTKRPASPVEMLAWTTEEMRDRIGAIMCANIITATKNGYALAIADLVEVRRMTKADEPQAFVKFNDRNPEAVQWCLVFNNVKALQPFKWEYDGKPLGKQGIGFVPEMLRTKVYEYLKH